MYTSKQTISIADSVSTSRIDMLIAIYDVAITAAEELETDLAAGRDGAAAKIQLLKALNLIESGLDLSLGELPTRVRDICVFISQRLLTADAEESATFIRTLRNLRDGFAEIRPEAVKLEKEGEIPTLTIRSIDAVA